MSILEFKDSTEKNISILEFKESTEKNISILECKESIEKNILNLNWEKYFWVNLMFKVSNYLAAATLSVAWMDLHVIPFT